MNSEQGQQNQPDQSSGRLDRRSFVALGAAGLAVAPAPAYAKSSRFPVPNVNLNRQNGELDVMYLYVPYMEEVLPQFEEETGITVNRVATYSGNDEWWARINAGEQADFLIGSTDWIQRAMAADLLTPIDLSAISNYDTLYSEFQENEITSRMARATQSPGRACTTAWRTTRMNLRKRRLRGVLPGMKHGRAGSP
jgi:spermidine/putrescine-binding protein